jgi:hypothetical protein
MPYLILNPVIITNRNIMCIKIGASPAGGRWKQGFSDSLQFSFLTNRVNGKQRPQLYSTSTNEVSESHQ